MQVLIINMFTQNSSPLVKSTMMSLLLMILRRSSDAIQWYNDTMGNNETAGNSSNIVMCSLSFMGWNLHELHKIWHICETTSRISHYFNVLRNNLVNSVEVYRENPLDDYFV